MKSTLPDNVMTQAQETVVLGAGCFWCAEAVFQRLEGVHSVTSGYAGGAAKNPTYRQVCTGNTGHAEVVKVVYNPQKISFKTLLEMFWSIHDPTSLNRQGADIGTQYRSVIFYTTESQRQIAEDSKKELEASGTLHGAKVVTQILPCPPFYPAEDYHAEYFNRNSDAPYCQRVILPKLKKVGLNP